ncbi:TetR/AcrR family transcriptional regulator [Streptomyces sp. cg40]|uniref:TetR/AcrR family transcriptional regulator n=1 Tax=Streptomyces sp. cg40 TaxID=3419764 RepID=UPI003D08E2F7
MTETTLDDIRARTSTSKSQLFRYFPGGKEELLLALAQNEADWVLSCQQPHLNALISQLTPASPGVRAVTSQLVASWQDKLAIGVLIMMPTGSLTHLEAALDLGIRQLRAVPSSSAASSSNTGSAGSIR